MIDNPIQQQLLLKHFPILEESTEEFRLQLYKKSTYTNIPAGHTVASEGSQCQQLALVISGQIRVYKLSESGREITLYRIQTGDSCVLTASCIMSNNNFPAIAQTETKVEAIIIPSYLAQEWITLSKAWCSFIFSLVSHRLSDIIAMLEELAFHHIDERLAAYLIALASQGKAHQITHHQIASDLGTTREVISRIMKRFETKGLISGSRGKLLIKNISGLQTYTQ